MPLVTAPINFVALRASLIAILSGATGLPESQFIYQRPESLTAPRPAYPYVGITVIQAAGMMEPDFYLPVIDSPGIPTGLFEYVGNRQMDVTLDVYAGSQDYAYRICAALQALLMQIPTRDALRAQGMAVQSVGGVVDISELLNTGYEGRAQVDVTLGLIASMQVDMGRIDTVDVTAQLEGETSEIAFEERVN